MRAEDERYFERLESQLDEAMEIAREAKARGGDPTPEVEIPVARDMADRVENILGIEGVAERVRELETQMSREEAALALAEDFAEGRVGDFETRAGKIEGAVRTAVALLTEGVVAAPIEGIDGVEILENDGGGEFVNVYYAGPIRSAGGTAQALSVLVADYTRALVGLDEYRARDEEIERYAEEVALYDSETGLQYSPKDEETKFIAKHLPIMLDGEPTSDEEVSGFRDLDRIDTNSARGGMCLVLAEGIALKAPKIQRYTRQLDEVDWPWLQDLIDGTYDDGGGEGGTDGEGGADSGSGGREGGDDGDSDRDEGESVDDGPVDDTDDGATSKETEVTDSSATDGGTATDGVDAAVTAAEEPVEPRAQGDDEDETSLPGPPRVEPAKKYLRDLIAGRPVFGHPSRPGGFRLRYGRARNHGFATAGVHPATMHLVDDFLATGTQIKTERPGKAAGVVPVDTIEGPTVRLANGDVRRIDDPEEAIEVRNGVTDVLDLGEYLVNYGEFVENNHPLAPASYVYEWWIQDFEAAGADVQALADSPQVDLEYPTAEEAIEWATDYDAPLHPEYTYCWHDLSVEVFEALAETVVEGRIEDDVLYVPHTDEARDALETLLIEHHQGEEWLTLDDWAPFVRTLGLSPTLRRTWTPDDLSPAARAYDDGENAIVAVNEVAPYEVRERAPTRIGSRMGRPEKSERRDLSPAVHTLFPIGEAGGDQRDVAKAASHADSMEDAVGVVEVQVGRRRCPDCETDTYKTRCPECDGRTEPEYFCPSCESTIAPDESGAVECARCEREATSVEYREVDVDAEYRAALDAVSERENAFEILKGVKGMMSATKTPEPVEKGVLRAKHDVSTFKDGTVRYDMTDLPVTSVRPSELDVTAGQLRALGYETDIRGDPLEHDDQLVELRVQDVVLSDGAAEHMLKTAAFVDDLLEQYYGLERFYEFEERQDLVGELVFGMAPHTSAATVGRVIGFTSAAVGYAHPFFHAAKRRNCFHPETTIRYEDESGVERTVPIERFVETWLTDPTEDDFGTLVQDLDGTVRVPSIDGAGSPASCPVESVSKHPAPAHLVRVVTEGGRTLTVTADHTMIVWREGPAQALASELQRGDSIPIPSAGTSRGRRAEVCAADGGLAVDTVARVEFVQSDVDHVYCLTVSQTHTLVANDLYVGQCDGDEDCIMLLLDGLLNFSKAYLPSTRGGRMDAPLVMSSRIDPAEIDDEAHNMDVVSRYPREFYEATRRMADPEEVEIEIAEATVGTDREYTGFEHTHDTSNVALGPDLSAYKTLGSMMDKMDAQLELARKLRAVDETDVAERVIEYHFLPDLIGNLRAFSRQETRCLDCGEKYRRVPLTEVCRECGGNVNLTVHQGSVSKYLQTATQVAEEYGCREYTKQRLEVLDRSISSVFENDKNKQSGIADFM